MPNGYKDKPLGITERQNSPLSISGRNSYYFFIPFQKLYHTKLAQKTSLCFVCLFVSAQIFAA